MVCSGGMLVLGATFLSLALGATVQLSPGETVGQALARLRPGDLLELGPGSYPAALGRLSGVKLRGAGPDQTRLVAPEGEDGGTVVGEVELSNLSLRAGPERCGLKVNAGGRARLRDLFLSGGSCGLFLDGGAVQGERIDLRGGNYGVLQRDGELTLAGGTAHGGVAGAGLLQGSLALSRMAIYGPFRDAGISVTRGEAILEAVVIAQPGPSGITVSPKGRLVGRDVSIAGPTERDGTLGDCVLAIGGEVRLSSSELLHCGGAAVEASRARIALDGVDLQGGGAGCLALVDGSRADLQGNRCTGQGPALVLASGSSAQLRMNRWLVDPVLWVECATGARATLLYGEHEREPCQPRPGSKRE